MIIMNIEMDARGIAQIYIEPTSVVNYNIPGCMDQDPRRYPYPELCALHEMEHEQNYQTLEMLTRYVLWGHGFHKLGISPLLAVCQRFLPYLSL
jgi:hypothetical protein